MKLRDIEFKEFKLDAEKLNLCEANFDASGGISAQAISHESTIGQISYLKFNDPDGLGWPYATPISIRLPDACSTAKAERIAAFINSTMSDDDERPLTAEEQRKIDDAWETHKAAGPWTGDIRPHLRPDGIPTRIDIKWMTAAELAIKDAMAVVEAAGGSPALTDAVNLLAKARDRVADHVEGDAAPAQLQAAAE